MSLSEKLLISILAALTVWLLTSAIGHFIRRGRLRAALLEDIKLHVAGAEHQQNAVRKLIKQHAIVGHQIPFPIYYNVGDFLLYRSLQKDLTRYLRSKELVKVIKYYQALWELDVCINGLASVLGAWERDAIKLTNLHINHLNNRKERIDSLCKVLSGQEIRDISDLPDDYRNVEGPETSFKI